MKILNCWILLLLSVSQVQAADTNRPAPQQSALVIIPTDQSGPGNLVRRGSGIMIGPNTLLTAAHVLYRVDGVENYRLRLDQAKVIIAGTGQVRGIRSAKILFHPSVPVRAMDGEYVLKAKENHAYLSGLLAMYDVAVVELDQPTGPFKTPYPGIAQRHAEVFGLYYFNGVRKVGRLISVISIPAVATYVSSFRVHTKVNRGGQLRLSALRRGDSGGPLYQWFAGRPRLFGIASTGWTGAASEGSDYARLDEIRDWLLAARRRVEKS